MVDSVTSRAADLIREARLRAGLTQAALAERAGTSQPAIARWESGRSVPSMDVVFDLVRAAGLDLETAIVPMDESDRTQALRVAELSGDERIRRHARLVRQLNELRQSSGA